ILTTNDLIKKKQDKKKITMITAYYYPSAKQVEAANADMLLVGDSLGMVVLGYNSTTKVTMDDMIHHAKAAKRGASNTFIVVDMPFMRSEERRVGRECSCPHRTYHTCASRCRR